MGRATNAIHPRLDRRDVTRDAKHQLNRVREVEFEIRLARLALPMLANHPQALLDLRRNPADRTEQIPQHRQQPLARPQQADAQQLFPFE